MSIENKDIINQKELIFKNQIIDSFDKLFLSKFNSTFDLHTRIKDEFGFDLHTNQIEIIENIRDLNISNLEIIASRSGGKTFSAIFGMIIISIDNTFPISIGITAPKLEQACRLIQTLKQKILPLCPYLNTLIDLKNSTNSRIVFKNGSFWEAFSGNDFSNEVGRHYDILLVDEAQDVSDYTMSKILLPMIANSKIAKLIKIGTPRGKNHFYKSSKDTTYKVLVYDWLHCPVLFNAGYIEYEGSRYPKTIYMKMPYRKCQEYFPNNPELWHDGDVSYDDFETEFECKWALDVDNFLDEQDINMLFTEEYKEPKIETIKYIFGLDMAGGSDVSIDPKNDYTVLTIGKIVNGVKYIVDSYSWQGDTINQIDDIIYLIHPITGKYRCEKGLIDRGQIGSAIYDQLIAANVKVTPIMYNARDVRSGKNNKNAMADHFKFELQSGRVKYPSLEYCNKHPVFKKHLAEWSSLEKKLGLGINAQIKAPSGLHDDCCFSTMQFVFCADDMTVNTNVRKANITRKLKKSSVPTMIKSVSTYASINKMFN